MAVVHHLLPVAEAQARTGLVAEALRVQGRLSAAQGLNTEAERGMDAVAADAGSLADAAERFSSSLDAFTREAGRFAAALRRA